MDTPHLVNHGTYLSKGSPSMRQALIWSRQLVASENFFFCPLLLLRSLGCALPAWLRLTGSRGQDTKCTYAMRISGTTKQGTR